MKKRSWIAAGLVDLPSSDDNKAEVLNATAPDVFKTLFDVEKESMSIVLIKMRSAVATGRTI